MKTGPALEATDAAQGTWVRVMPSDDLWEGDVKTATVGDQDVMLVRLPGGEVRAYQGDCPHQGMVFTNDDFDGEILTCSAHRWTFDLATGCGLNPKTCCLDCFPVSIRNEAIYVKVHP